MTDKKESPAKSKLTPDWLVSGVLSKIGDTFDKLTGRGWKPSSSLATSELVERLKKMLDTEVKETNGNGRFVPHIIKLKMQWDKFSTDSETGLKKLQNELLTAAIDHINDNRYHTYAPLKVEVKPDYFTEGVKLYASFDEFGADEKEVELNVTVPQIKVGDLIPPALAQPEPEPEVEKYIAEFSIGGKQKTVELKFTKGKRLPVGRTAENSLVIDDASISKHHATLMVNPQGKFLVADTGSTNGTFINNERIAYGRAFAVGEGDKVKFGSIEIFFRQVPRPTTFVAEVEDNDYQTEAFQSENKIPETPQPPPAATSQADIKTEAYKSNDNYELETRKAPARNVENQTFQVSQHENYETFNGKEEDFSDGNVENEESAPSTQPAIKLNFRDDQ